jgi:serine/threonine-protein kinase
VPAPLRPLVARGLAKDPGRRPADADALATELRAIAAGAYGADWEAHGRSHLGEAALLLALLWPSAAAPALASATVEHVTLSQALREATTRLASPHTRTRPLTEKTTKHLLSQAQRHTLHVLHLDHLAHQKYLRRLRNAALGVTGAAVVAAGVTVAATSGSHPTGGSDAAAAHPAVVAYPVSLASTPAAAAPAPSPTASATALPASCDNWPNNIIYAWAAQPVTTASLGQSVGQLIATCTGTVTSVTCSTYFQYEPNDYLCSIPAEVGMPHSSVIYVFPGGAGEWQYTGEGTN